MDAITDPAVREIWVMKSAQVGWTECLLNTVGYHVHRDPSPILMVQPTSEIAEAFSKDRLSPMVRDTPALTGKIANPKARDSGNTILHKALAVDTPLPTPSGWTTMGDVAVGDRLFDECGRLCTVTYVTPVVSGRPCYRVTFSDGASIVADESHPWWVQRWAVDKSGGKARQRVRDGIVTTADLARGTPARTGRKRYAIPVAKALDLPEQQLPVDPYVLGAWLGDGSSHRAAITVGQHDAVEMESILRKCGCEPIRRQVSPGAVLISLDAPEVTQREGSTGQWRKRTTGVHAGLRKIGVLGKIGGCQKAVPGIYLRASTEQRLALLQGLMDTDGHIRRDGTCIFTSSRTDLSNAMTELLTSLGIRSTAKRIETSYRYLGELRRGRDAQVIAFAAPSDTRLVFRLQRKLDRQLKRRPVTTRATRRRVVAVDSIASVSVRCISVDSPNHLYLAGRAMVPTHNTFPGGHITLAGANSPSSLASRPIRILLCDEVDKYPTSAGAEGDPISLARKRTTAFWNRKMLAGSTPTIKGQSRVESGFMGSDQRYFHVPCPRCGALQRLVWAQVKWTEFELAPEDAVYQCVHCGTAITDVERIEVLQHGEWRASKPFNGIAGFHVNELMSPFVTMGEMATAFLEAKKLPETLQTWVNSSLGETFEDTARSIEPEGLAARREQYSTELLPAGTLMLTLGVDTQDDRLEAQLVAWGSEEESWILEHRRLPGDPGVGWNKGVWRDLTLYRRHKYLTEDGRTLTVQATAVDFGGHFSQQVANYSFRHRFERVFAIRGAGGVGRLAWPRKPGKTKLSKADLYTVGVDTIKDLLYGRLAKITPPDPGEAKPGFIHLPVTTDEEFCDQLVSETKIYRQVQGRRVAVWRPKRLGVRQEAQDCWVYAYAAMLGRGLNLTELAAALAARIEKLGAKAKARPAPSKPAKTDQKKTPPAEPPQPEPAPKRRKKTRFRSTRSRYLTR